jgi:hypothetical protein
MNPEYHRPRNRLLVLSAYAESIVERSKLSSTFVTLFVRILAVRTALRMEPAKVNRSTFRMPFIGER